MHLGLHPAGYRCHSLRPSGTSPLATHEGTTAQLQTACHWASLSVAQQYIQAGEAAQAEIASVLVGPDSQPTSPVQAPQPIPAEPPLKSPFERFFSTIRSQNAPFCSTEQLNY